MKGKRDTEEQVIGFFTQQEPGGTLPSYSSSITQRAIQ